jgi:purine-nucleoside phosphorylase
MTQIVEDRLPQALAALRSLSSTAPVAAFVLGSGVKVLEDLADSRSVSFEEAFGHGPGVVGHDGSISVGHLGDRLVAVIRGRFHLYEGHSWDIVTLPTCALVSWGVERLYLTNAAGGLNGSFQVGDLMLIEGYRDFLNPKLAQTGLLPAIKAGNIDSKNALTKHLHTVGQQLSSVPSDFRPLQKGIYAGCLGPSYESLAEIEMLKSLGADAVGMSTVPELETAQQAGIGAAAVSVITNVWKPDEAIGGHEEVLQAAKEASQRLDKLFRAVVSDKQLP